MAPRSASPSPYLTCAPGSQAPPGGLRLFCGGRGRSRPGANQRPEEARPVSRTPRCSLVSSQLVVKATGALKISFKEPPSGGARGVVMTTRPQVPTESFLRSHQVAGFGGVGWRGPEIPAACRWTHCLPPRTLPQVWASASSWGAPPSALTDPSELTHKTIKALFFFCPFAKDRSFRRSEM